MREKDLFQQEHLLEIRITYSHTDRMGFAYYSHYLVWFEMGRTEWLRERGVTYRELEERGIWLPVRKCWCEYKSPALYDEVLEVRTWLKELQAYRLLFGYEIRKKDNGQLVVRGGTEHAFISPEGKLMSYGTQLREFLTSAHQSGNSE